MKRVTFWQFSSTALWCEKTQVWKLYITGLGFICKKRISFCFIFILFDFMVDKNYDGNYYLFDFNKVNK